MFIPQPPMLYPSWRYHVSGTSCIVQTPDGEAQLGPNWAMSPAGPFGSTATVDEVEHPQPPTPEPTAIDTHAIKPKALVNMAKTIMDVPTLEAMLAHEQSHPTMSGGRPSVLAAIAEQLDALKGPSCP